MKQILREVTTVRPAVSEPPLLTRPPLPTDAAGSAFRPAPRHAHVVAADSRAHRSCPSAPYHAAARNPPYLGMLRQTGMSRGCACADQRVRHRQPLHAEGKLRHPDLLRGVGVVAPDVSDQELEATYAAGVRGLGINVLFGGIGFDATRNAGASYCRLGLAHEVPDGYANYPTHALPVPGGSWGHMPVADGNRQCGLSGLAASGARPRQGEVVGAYRIATASTISDVTPWAQTLIDTASRPHAVGSDRP